MARRILSHRNGIATAGAALALLLAACSSGGNAGSVPQGSGSRGGSSSGASSGGGAGGDNGGGAGSSTSGDDNEGSAADDASSDDGDGSATGDDAADDATAPPFSSRDASTGRPRRDAGVRDASSPVVIPDASTTPVGDAGAALAAARAQCVQIINQDRATLSPASPPLTEDTAEEACVDGQAQADFTADTAHSAFGHCHESAQDECPGWPGPPSAIMTKCLAQMWAEGPPAAGQDNHWLNMSNAKYTKVACGFYQTPSGSWWATQDFF
jgi:hypothetical protein